MLAVLAASGAVAPATKTALIIITIIMVLPVPALPFSVAGISRDRMALVGEWAAHRRYQRDERSRSAAILSLYPRFLLFAFVIAGIGATIIGVAATSLLRGRTLTTGSVGITSSVTDIGSVVALAIVYLVMYLAIGVAQRFYLQHELWRVVAQSLRRDDLDAAANVTNEGVPAGALGEGLVDSLDVAGL
jgi:hypothetical protein